jgi:anti-sigma B factor antagonist
VTLPNDPVPVREAAEHGGLTIHLLPAKTRCVVLLDGELDLASVPTLERELSRLIAAEPEMLIVDLERLSFIDSSGLRCLLEAANAAASNGDALRFMGATGHVEEMLQLTDIKRQLRFID